MGEIAEMMLNGEMCQYCGEWLESEAGYPNSCYSCSDELDEKTKEIFCVECSNYVDARLTNGSEIYPHRKDLSGLNFYKCDDCKNHVGCHKGTENPLGCIATKELMKARQQIHAILDPLWKSKTIKRNQLYKKMSDILGYNYHTSWTRSIEEARQAYKAVLKIRKELGVNNEPKN